MQMSKSAKVLVRLKHASMSVHVGHGCDEGLPQNAFERWMYFESVSSKSLVSTPNTFS